MKKLFLLLAMLLLSATCYGWSDNDYSDEDKAIVADALTKAIYDIDGNGVVDSVDTGGSMTYPGAGIAVSTGSAWDTSITNNSANWNTAYGWGNHASAGYLTAETDPDFNAWLLATPPLYSESDPTVDLTKIQGLVTNDFHNLGGTDAVDDADNDPTNEIQDLSGYVEESDTTSWDKNASDDFTWDYDYTDLIHKPSIPSYTFGTGLSEVGGHVICTVVDTNTTYSASDFDIKDLTDSTNLRAAWSAKLDSEVDGSTTNEINTVTGDNASTTSGLAITIAGAGTVATSVSGDTVTITGTGDGTGTDDQTASEVSTTTTGFGGILTNDANSNDVQKCLDKIDDHDHGFYMVKIIAFPDQLQIETDDWPLWTIESGEYPSGITITDIGIKTPSSSSYTVSLLEYTSPTDGSPSTIESGIATSSSTEAEDDGTIADASVAAGSIIYVDLDTDDVSWVMIWIKGVKN